MQMVFQRDASLVVLVFTQSHHPAVGTHQDGGGQDGASLFRWPLKFHGLQGHGVQRQLEAVFSQHLCFCFVERAEFGHLGGDGLQVVPFAWIGFVEAGKAAFRVTASSAVAPDLTLTGAASP